MMNAALRAFVRERAGRRCEYCRLHEDDADFFVQERGWLVPRYGRVSGDQ